MPSTPLQQLRLTAATVHAIPGSAVVVSVAVPVAGPRELVVARHRLDADLGPCAFRALVGAARADPTARVLDRVVGCRFDSGIVELGAGILGRYPTSREQRWFATLLRHDAVVELLAGCPVDLPDDVVSARVIADTVCDVSVVCLDAPAGAWSASLDEAAVWACGACLVAELEELVSVRAR